MKSLEELIALRDKARAEMGVREGQDDSKVTRVVVGMGTCGISAGARPVLTTLVNLVAEHKLEDVTVGQAGCMGLCENEPIVQVLRPDGTKTTYVDVTPEKAKEIVEKDLVQKEIVTEYTVGELE